VTRQAKGKRGYAGVVWVLALACCWLASAVLVRTGLAPAEQVPDTGQNKPCDDARGKSSSQWGASSSAQDAPSRVLQQAYTDNGNGTVTDCNTGLIWQRGDEQNETSRNWREALDYCAGLELAGHRDWRLPTIEELRTLVDPGKSDPTINTRYFPDCYSYHYWSSSTSATNPDDAWLVAFYFGHAHWYPKDVVFCYVRCVRGGPESALWLLDPIAASRMYTSRNLQEAISHHLTGQHGCRELGVAYRDEDGDRQMAVSVNLMGLGRLGAGYAPSICGLKLTD
jgi:hypothetical protein